LSEAEIASCALRVPMLDIHTVGAGGGSIAWRDAGGALRVGPQSAGSDPGPACLGRGEHATVTDANVVLGRIRAHDYLGGRIALDPRRAERAVAKLAASLGLDVHATALGIVRVVNATMEQALRVVSVERGLDVRDFSLLAFGGAAGLHAADLVRALGLRGALVPAHAAVLSALGLVHADVEKDFGQSVLVPAGDADWRRLFAPLLARARRELRVEGVARPRLERSLDMRYVGQSFELNVPWSAHFERDFHRLHARRYGFAADGEPVEIVAVRVRAVGRVQPPSSVRSSVPRTVRKSETQSLHFEMQGRGRTLPARVVQRAALRPSHRLRGPALVLEPDTTILVPPDFVARVRSHGGLWLEPRARRG
jgi:N-methylhydantoinase A